MLAVSDFFKQYLRNDKLINRIRNFSMGMFYKNKSLNKIILNFSKLHENQICKHIETSKTIYFIYPYSLHFLHKSSLKTNETHIIGIINWTYSIKT